MAEKSHAVGPECEKSRAARRLYGLGEKALVLSSLSERSLVLCGAKKLTIFQLIS